MILRRFIAVLALLVLAGCANVAKVSAGNAVIGDRLSADLGKAWNQVNLPGLNAIVWTQDGITLDALQFWVGVKDNQPIAPPGQDKRPLNFKATMQPHEIVALMQGYYARDGSTVTLDKLEPADFGGTRGVRFEFTVLRKFDEVKLAGRGWASVRGGELFAMGFTAPRLGFFPRHADEVEAVARSVRIK